MTREDFMVQKVAAERQISRRGIPVGIIYSIRVASFFAGIVLAVILWKSFDTAARSTIVCELAVCLLLFIVSFPMERASKKKFLSLALKCPSCQCCLVFLRAMKTEKTGCCYQCGKRVFDL